MKTSFHKLQFILLLLVSTATQAQLIKHSYRFFNNLEVSLPECGPKLDEVPVTGNCNQATTGGQFIQDLFPQCGVSRTVYHNNLNWGLRYPNTAGTITNTYTIHLYVKNVNFGNRTWSRIIDFSNGTQDAGIYYKTFGTASSNRCLDFFPNGVVGTCPYFDNTTYYLLTFTRNGVTGIIDVYVNNTLFTSYNDIAGKYVGTSGVPIYIYRDDQVITCESAEANFAYLSFTNQYSDLATVNAVYNDICNIANSAGSANFSIQPPTACALNTDITVMYTGDINPPGTGYTFNWNWDGGTVISGSGIGPYVVRWGTTGTKNVTLTITNNNCGQQNSITRQITLSQNPTSTIIYSICQGETYEGYNSSGNYTDTFSTASGCDSIRILNLTVKPKSFSNASHAICEGQVYQGHSTSGVYSDTLVGSNGCDSIITLSVTVYPKTRSTVSISICDGQNYQGHSTAGTYLDTLINANGCDSIRTLVLTVNENPSPDLGLDKEICSGDTLLLNPGVFDSYRWQDGSVSQNFIAKVPGIYSVTVTNNCGSATAQVRIRERSCDIYFPTAFSPNGDRNNDVFKILNAYGLTSFNLSIYNQWGLKIFETNDPAKGWDGTYNGVGQNTGAYVWMCRYKKNNIEVNRRGVVMLIR